MRDDEDPAGALKFIESVVDGVEEIGKSFGEAADNVDDFLLPPGPAPTTNPAIPLSATKEINCDDDTNTDCKSRVNYIIRPLKDGPNQEIRVALDAMHLPKPYFVSKDPKRGMFFCLAGLKKTEVDRLKNRQDVAFVHLDLPVESDTPYKVASSPADLPNGSDNLADDNLSDLADISRHKRRSSNTRSNNETLWIKHNTSASGDFHKRSSNSPVQIQRQAPVELVSLSTPPRYFRALTDYIYSSESGEGITVYTIEYGLEPLNKEFITNAVVKKWLFAVGADRTTSDDFPLPTFRGHGSCIASKIAGYEYGVAKKAKLVVVKIVPTVSSILDAFQLIIKDLHDRKKAGEMVEGYTVVTMSSGWAGDIFSPPIVLDKEDASLALKIKTLHDDYQTVVAVAAGNKGKIKPEINETPAKFSATMPIITVGNVLPNGQKDINSQGGPALTMSAVGHVGCAAPYPGRAIAREQGTSFSAAIVAGLIADLLSRQKEGGQLRLASPFIPEAVRDYMVKLAWVRVTGGPLVAWNGIYPPRTQLGTPSGP